MTPRWRLFPKYALLIIALVGGMLIASGAISIYFSWRENQGNLIALQVEKAQAAATRIEQYILDIEHQLGWTALPALDVSGNPLEQRRIEYLKLLRQAPGDHRSGLDRRRRARAAADLASGDGRGRQRRRLLGRAEVQGRPRRAAPTTARSTSARRPSRT